MKASYALSSLQQGILICNRQSKIIYFNKAYEGYLGIPLQDAIGKRIDILHPSARAPQVIETGESQEGVIRREGTKEYLANIYPIYEDGQITGSISIVTSLIQENQRTKSSTLAERVHAYEKHEIEIAIAANGGGTEGKRKAAKDLGISLATLYNKLQN